MEINLDARYRLEPRESPKQGVSRVAQGELELTIGLLQAAPNGGGDAEAIHEARKALKRLRTLLRVTRPALEKDRYRQENVALRDAGRGLSDARDAQALLEALDSLLKGFGDELPPGTWRGLRSSLAVDLRRQVLRTQAQPSSTGARRRRCCGGCRSPERDGATAIAARESAPPGPSR